MSMTLLPEIREGEASPEIALIYADIRRCMRLPLVNLIYRHFATLPGVLPQIWGLVRAMILSGELETALLRMYRDLPIPQLTPFDESTIGRLDHLDQATIRRVLQAYNRGNGLNLNALTAINLGHRQQRLGIPEIAEAVPDFEAPPLPRLLRLAELDRKTANQLAHIALLHDGGPGVVPSLYLHLAHWPEFLAATCSRIEPLLNDGSIERARRAAVDIARAKAERLLLIFLHGTTSVKLPEQAVGTLDLFVNRVIPEMIPVGLAVETALLGAVV